MLAGTAFTYNLARGASCANEERETEIVPDTKQQNDELYFFRPSYLDIG